VATAVLSAHRPANQPATHLRPPRAHWGQVKGKSEELCPVAPLLSYASVSLSNVVATTCQYEALKHVTFAVQTLGKCAKMFPVMAWGYFILRKRYTARDVLLAIAITAGCFVFFTSGPTVSRVSHDKHSSVYGLLLMMGYLTADGYTSTFQQRMFKGHQMSSYNQVLYTSLCSMALSSFGECERRRRAAWVVAHVHGT
jgi:adenosine 3'-phospho 5'-phosphosulfate transporter B2